MVQHIEIYIIDRIFELLLENGNDNPTRNFFEKFWMPLVEIKDFNALIDNKTFFDHQ